MNTEVFVSADAKVGEGDGSIDNPYANILEAKAYIREVKEDNSYPEEGITVYFREGQYHIEKTVLFDEADSGEEGAPVVYSAYEDETVVFVGGIDEDLSAFSNITDEAIKARLAEGTENKIKQIDLASLGITDYGELNVYGHADYYFRVAGYDYPRAQAPELFFNGEVMSLSRYPNEDWCYIASVVDVGDAMNTLGWFSGGKLQIPEEELPEKLKGSVFTVGAEAKEHMARWGSADQIWVYGNWREAWSDQAMPVASIDAATGTVTTEIPSTYAVKEGKNFYFYNLLEELDAPGEYFIDRTSGILYFYPPEETGTVTLSLLEGAAVELKKGAHDIDFVGIDFKAGRGNAISLNTVERVNVKDSEISNFAKMGIYMADCKDVIISGCHIYDLGSSGIYAETITGSEIYRRIIENLENMGNIVENCEIHSFSRISRTYTPAVKTSGVGMIVRNCKIYDAPHVAIIVEGNNTLIENNEIFDVLKETGDAGVIYSGFKKHEMGIMIRNNYIHDVSSSTPDSGIYAVYCDDTKDGVTVESNLIVNVGGSAMFINGGWDNNFRYNVVINNTRASVIGAIGLAAGNEVATNPSYALLHEVYEYPAYQNYPHWEEKLPTILEKNSPKYNEVKNNVIINCTEDLRYAVNLHTTNKEEIYNDNTLVDSYAYNLAEAGFTNIANGDYKVEDGSVQVTSSDFTLKEDSVIFDDIDGFVAFDLTKIGLIGESLEIPGPLGKLGEEATVNEVDVDTLIADATNWEATENFTPVFQYGTMNLTSTNDAGAVANYTGQTFTNSEFSFKYKQEHLGDAATPWGGFYIQLAPNVMSWLTKSVLVCMKENQIELQYWGYNNTYQMFTKEGSYLKVGEEQDITFGLYDVDATQVRMVLTIDGAEIFNEVVAGTGFTGFSGYFGVIASKGGVSVTIGESTLKEVDVNTLIADEENWEATEGFTPTFLKGTMNLTSTNDAGAVANYTGQTFTNSVFSFKYKQEHQGNATTPWGGFYIQLAPNVMSWLTKSVLVCMKENQVELQYWGYNNTYQMFTKEGSYLKVGEEQDITFGLYDVDATQVRMVLTIDGAEIFNEVVAGTGFTGFSGYFGVIASKGGVSVTIGEKAPEVKSVEISGGDSVILPAVGDTHQLETKVVIEPEAAADLKYAVEDTSVATVSESGLLTAVKKGTTKVTVWDSRDESIKDEVTVIVPLYYEDFEDAVAAVWGDDSNRSANMAHSGTYSFATGANLTRGNLVGDLSGKVISVWIYDPYEDAPEAAGFFGFRLNPWYGMRIVQNESYYMYRAGEGNVASAVERSKGWHEFKYVLSEADATTGTIDCDMYIDGEFVFKLEKIDNPTNFRLYDLKEGIYVDDFMISQKSAD